MKRVFCLIGALLLTAGLVFPAFASESIFVPSITYKDGLEIVDAEMDGKDVTDCLVVTSILEAKNATTDIFQSDRDLLLDIYTKLENNTMKLPIEDQTARSSIAAKEYIVRELVDVSFKKTACVEQEHGHKEWLAKEDTVIYVEFKLDIEDDQELAVFTYINGEWIPVENVKNNGGGTVTCTFADICPVAFCVSPSDPVESSPATSDTGVSPSWFIMLFIASMLLFFVIFLWRRNKQEEDEEDNKVNPEI